MKKLVFTVLMFMSTFSHAAEYKSLAFVENKFENNKSVN